MKRATARGREFAVAALAERRRLYADSELPKNDSLPAGSVMFFHCIGCNGPIVVPEDYLTKPDLCGECGALAVLGWME